MAQSKDARREPGALEKAWRHSKADNTPKICNSQQAARVRVMIRAIGADRFPPMVLEVAR
jgi:hypothetical protein